MNKKAVCCRSAQVPKVDISKPQYIGFIPDITLVCKQLKMCRLGCSVLPQSRNIASKLGDRDDRTTDPQKNYRPINDIIPSFFFLMGISMGKWPDF